MQDIVNSIQGVHAARQTARKHAGPLCSEDMRTSAGARYCPSSIGWLWQRHLSLRLCSESFSGRDAALFAPFHCNRKKPLKKVERRMHLSFNEQDVLSRLEKDRGAALDQSERVYVVTKEPLLVLERKRTHYAALGSTRGNTFGPVHLPDWSDSNETWITTIEKKSKIVMGLAPH